MRSIAEHTALKSKILKAALIEDFNFFLGKNTSIEGIPQKAVVKIFLVFLCPLLCKNQGTYLFLYLLFYVEGTTKLGY